MLSVTLSKIGIINPAILDSDDLKDIINEHSTNINITVTDLMQVAQIKVLLNNHFLHFIIKYPKPSLECKKIIIYPVQHNGTILNFAGNDIVADCSNQVIPIGNCTSTLSTTFCKKLSYTTCAQQLHSGVTAHCTTRPSHLEALIVIDEGVIIINENTATVNEQTVTGTFLITFDNEVRVNGTLFRNWKNFVKKSSGPASSALLNITGHREILILIQKLSVENLRYIAQMEEGLKQRPIISGLAAIAFLVFCYATLQLYKKHHKDRRQHDLQSVIDGFRKTEDALNLSEGGVNTSCQTVDSGCLTTCH